jgi:hypothetical protein
MLSSNENKMLSRRHFLVAAGYVAIAGIALDVPINAGAADLPHVAESDQTAQALGYREDASQVDSAKYPSYKKGAACASCQFFQNGANGFGSCQMFPGKAVSAKGWCSAYAAKA